MHPSLLPRTEENKAPKRKPSHVFIRERERKDLRRAACRAEEETSEPKKKDSKKEAMEAKVSKPKNKSAYNLWSEGARKTVKEEHPGIKVPTLHRRARMLVPSHSPTLLGPSHPPSLHPPSLLTHFRIRPASLPTYHPTHL